MEALSYFAYGKMTWRYDDGNDEVREFTTEYTDPSRDKPDPTDRPGFVAISKPNHSSFNGVEPGLRSLDERNKELLCKNRKKLTKIRPISKQKDTTDLNKSDMTRLMGSAETTFAASFFFKL
jgi:hypothetical protein